jgi:CRISPR-associated protein Csm4
MKTYRLKIKPLSSFLTPWQADTIFGSICWIIALRDGEEALKNFLLEYKSRNPIFVLSDGMPGDLLPAPSHLPYIMTKPENREDYEKGKKLKKVLWISPEKFESIRRGHLQDDLLEDCKPFKTFTSLHSSINRVTGTTGEEGALFELQEYALGTSVHTISIYLKIRDGWEEKVFSLFNDLSLMGYGKKKSVGKGCFKIIGGLEQFETFERLEDSNGFLSLSNFVPSASDPTEGYYKTMVKYGKLGGEFTFSENPFKKPLMMITTGSVFKVNEAIKPFYGRMVEGLSSIKPEVVHYGYAFALPIYMAYPTSIEI